VILSCAVCAAQATTGIWTNVSSGYWADSANWQGGVVPSTANTMPGTGDVADFTALADGETVTITNHTACGALIFSNTVGTSWTLLGSTMKLANSPSFPLGGHGEIKVDGGTLDLAAPVTSATDGVAKTGSGTLRMSVTNTYAGNTRINQGTVSSANGSALAVSAVRFNAADALLTLEGDAWIGGVVSHLAPSPNILLNGHTLRVGGAGGHSDWNGRITGEGELVMVRGEVQTLTSSQTIDRIRLDNGSLRLGKITGKTVGWYLFNDATDIAKDSSSSGNALVKSGTPTQWHIQDTERGSVLHLDNNATLVGAGTGQSVSGLPANNQSFTVAFWIKPDADCTANAGLFGWGDFGTQRAVNFMRMRSSTEILYSNWGRDRGIILNHDLKDGAWHHFAVVYNGQQTKVYHNGELIHSDVFTEPLLVINKQFSIGQGWADAPCFKGRFDDFLITDWAMNETDLHLVRTGSQGPETMVYAKDDLLPTTSSVEIGYNGRLYLAGDQTIATLDGDGAAGGIVLQGGGTFTVAGDGGATSTVFRSAISGDGGFVKRGSSYALTLSGGNSYTGVTEVQEGRLTLAPSELQGLQAYYRFDDPSCLGWDSSGNGYHLNAKNTPSYAANGKYGGSAAFSATNQDMLFANDGVPESLPTGNRSYTLACWCNPDANVPGIPVYWGYAGVMDHHGNLIRFRAPPNNKSILISNFGNNIYPDVGFDLFDDSINDGWHHIAVTYESTSRLRNVYVDGVLKFTDTLSQNLSVATALFQVGYGGYAGTYYEGRVDEVMIFDRALEAAEVGAAMSGRVALPKEAPIPSKLSAGLVARYSFEHATNIGKDSGPYGYDLTPKGTVLRTSHGVSGQALDLSSAYGYLTWTNSVFPEMMPTGNQAVTFSAWFNPLTDAGTEGAAIVFLGNAASKECHFIRLWQRTNESPKGLRFADGNKSVDSDRIDGLGYGTVPEGWHHVAAVYEPGATGKNRRLYIDGILMGYDGQRGLNVKTNFFHIGRQDLSGKWFQGLIDEVEIYNYALAPAEILAVMRRRSDVLPTQTTLSVATGAVVDMSGAEQRVAALTGAGAIELDAGILTIAGGTNQFHGTLTGAGTFAVRDGAAQTLTGAGTFNGLVVVSNATLFVENVNGAITAADSAVVVQSDGRIGGYGTIGGNLSIENGGGVAVGAVPGALTITGAVTLGATGTVTLPPEFTGGVLTLLNAASVTAPDGMDGWQVEPAQPSMAVAFRVSETAFSVSVFQRGTLISIR